MAVFLVLWNPIGRTWLCSDKGIQVTVLLKGNRNSCGDCWREKKKNTQRSHYILSNNLEEPKENGTFTRRTKLIWSDLFYNLIYLPTQTGGSSMGLWSSMRTWQSKGEWVSEWFIDWFLSSFSKFSGSLCFEMKELREPDMLWLSCKCMCHIYLNNALR